MAMDAFQIADTFRRGLSSTERRALNDGLPTKMSGVRPSPNGLQSQRAIQNLFGTPPTIAHPFPQYFSGRLQRMLAFETSIERVDAISLARNALTTYDIDSPTTPKSLASGGPWDFIDLGYLRFAMCNNAQTILHLGDNPWYPAFTAVVRDTNFVNSGCRHQGRIVFSRLGSLKFGPTLNTMFLALVPSSHRPSDYSMGLGETHQLVYWTAVNDPSFFFRHIVNGTDWPTDNQEELFRWKENSVGFMPLDFPGPVHTIRPLGGASIVYGEHGISALVSHTDPEPTYALRSVAPFGIHSRCAVVGDDRGHVFLDQEGTLWQLGADLSLTRLGFQPYFAPLLTGEVVISHNAHDDEFYICGAGNIGYILTPNGLVFAHRQPLSIAHRGGALVGIVNRTHETAANNVRTGFHDMGVRTPKTIHAVELGCSYPADWSVSLHFRNDANQTVRTRGPVTASKNGRAEIAATCTEFAVDLTCPYDTPIDLDYIRVHYNIGGRVLSADIQGG